MAPMPEIRSCGVVTRTTGVLPRGAHVFRTNGSSMKPVSSTNTMYASSPSAFFMTLQGPEVLHAPPKHKPASCFS
jgi:hypothetical protein